MELSVTPFTVHKRFALTISRGTSSENTNLWVRIEDQGIEGWGEVTAFSITQEGYNNTDRLFQEIEELIPSLRQFSPLDRQQIETFLRENQISRAVRAGIDIALYDWLGKKAHLPLWQLWGLDRSRIVPTSVTVGISSPEEARTRVRNWTEIIDVKIVKVKLGSPEGIEADQRMLLAIREELPKARLTVDANGGWNLENSLKMCYWLAQQGVEYVEQPLAVGEEEKLSLLYPRSPLPIFVDESCFTSEDIPKLASRVDGINIKIMKAGGLTEVMRMIDVAKGCRLKVMFGCYSDSSLANTAMCHLAPLADYLDLDSHLNLIDDPFTGVTLEQGRLLPNDLPGLGIQLTVQRNGKKTNN
ncbi:Mandelate racemase/muconate lactonizing protein [Gloeothece citriformis PCC 7424]|uniref:Dipeptide epimerase n=1 Tax=Gloeothece citriformis (strain PCC 7424) TaxID=65393 RepID=B7KGP9_GLOC7|nr:dipeptide epimerase [Gloeothece citriformis]ACK71976.1 Mandelate racemase/muconate lactonizing protein [Gloeothece citriformis PCC 7424]